MDTSHPLLLLMTRRRPECPIQRAAENHESMRSPNRYRRNRSWSASDDADDDAEPLAACGVGKIRRKASFGQTMLLLIIVTLASRTPLVCGFHIQLTTAPPKLWGRQRSNIGPYTSHSPCFIGERCSTSSRFLTQLWDTEGQFTGERLAIPNTGGTPPVVPNTHHQVLPTSLNSNLSLTLDGPSSLSSASSDNQNRVQTTGNDIPLQNNNNNGRQIEITPSTVAAKDTTTTTTTFSSSQASVHVNGTEHPVKTENGGFAHTTASRAKISAANKGNVPWNKGKTRSEETKAKIAAGVRARNRANLLAKLEKMGLTEEEYEAQKREEKRKREAERRARRTANGGYRPTEETKKKISRILKAKYASGEIKPNNSTNRFGNRKGFKHTAETRAKISESLKKRWATDEEYRERMRDKALKASADLSIRQRISDTLRNKWLDPEFRDQMMDKISQRRPVGSDKERQYKAKISAAIKAKWQEKDYREKNLASLAKRFENMPRKPRKSKPATRKVPRVAKMVPKVARTATPTTSSAATTTTTTKAKPRSVKVPTIKRPRAAVAPKQSLPISSPTTTATPKKRKAAKRVAPQKKAKKKGASPAKSKKVVSRDGNIELLREERRDLYDLLYGDDGDDDDDDSADADGEGRIAALLDDDSDDNDEIDNATTLDYDDDSLFEESDKAREARTTGLYKVDDDNLDSFDPYGLDNF